MALCCAFSEIFNVEKYHNLEIVVKGQSRSWKVVTFDRLRIQAEPAKPESSERTRNKSIIQSRTMHTSRRSCHSNKKGVNYYVNNHHA